MVSEELSEAAAAFGTPRRTTLLDAGDVPVVGSIASGGLEAPDEPCAVILTATGKLLRTPHCEPIPQAEKRVKHDAVSVVVRSTTRSTLGAITNKGRLIRFTPIALPSSEPPALAYASGSTARDYVIGLESGEKVLTIVPLDGTPIALGTRKGVIKRVDGSALPDKSEVSIINLDADDEVVGAGLAPDGLECVFVTHNAQLLHFPVQLVRPQGVGAAGVAGINRADDDVVIAFSCVDLEQSDVVTVSSPGATIAGTDPGRAKITPLTEFPGKGRATGGVRSHTLLKGEIGLSLAFVGVSPRAVGSDGSPRDLPLDAGKRDGSGQPLVDVVHAIGSPAL